jgi:hypothetical protein
MQSALRIVSRVSLCERAGRVKVPDDVGTPERAVARVDFHHPVTRPPPTPSAGPLVPRIINAILLRRDFYAAVAADAHATGPAAGVVCLTALARESVGLASMAQVHPVWGLAALSIVIMAVAVLLITYVPDMSLGILKLLGPGFACVLRCLGFA